MNGKKYVSQKLIPENSKKDGLTYSRDMVKRKNKVSGRIAKVTDRNHKKDGTTQNKTTGIEYRSKAHAEKNLDGSVYLHNDSSNVVYGVAKKGGDENRKPKKKRKVESGTKKIIDASHRTKNVVNNSNYEDERKDDVVTDLMNLISEGHRDCNGGA